MKPKPVVGQILYSLNVNNAARYNKSTLTPVTVKHVGRKYFTTTSGTHYSERSYYLEDWRENTEYTANSKLYISEQEYLDELKTKELYGELNKYFDFWGAQKLSLSTLEKIKELIDKDIKQ